jgi:hypothetical protein
VRYAEVSGAAFDVPKMDSLEARNLLLKRVPGVKILFD